MMSTPAILHKPTFKSFLFSPFKLNQAKPISFHRFPASKSDFFSSKNKALSKNMTELVRMSAFGGGNGSDSEESTGLFQQEAVIDGLNEFQSGLLADGLEATLNRLTCENGHKLHFLFAWFEERLVPKTAEIVELIEVAIER